MADIPECKSSPRTWKDWLLEVAKIAPGIVILGAVLALYFQPKEAAANTQKEMSDKIEKLAAKVAEDKNQVSNSLARLEEGQKYIIKTLDELKKR